MSSLFPLKKGRVGLTSAEDANFFVSALVTSRVISNCCCCICIIMRIKSSRKSEATEAELDGTVVAVESLEAEATYPDMVGGVGSLEAEAS